MTQSARVSAVDAACDWLALRVPVGEVIEAGQVLLEARHAGHSASSIARARWRLRIDSMKQRGRHAPWLWERL